MKIKTAAALMAFAVTMDNGEDWFRLFSADPAAGATWMRRDGNTLVGITDSQQSTEQEAAFREWVAAEKLKAIEAMKAQGYQVIEVDTLNDLQFASSANDGPTTLQ